MEQVQRGPARVGDRQQFLAPPDVDHHRLQQAAGEQVVECPVRIRPGQREPFHEVLSAVRSQGGQCRQQRLVGRGQPAVLQPFGEQAVDGAAGLREEVDGLLERTRGSLPSVVQTVSPSSRACDVPRPGR